MQEEQEVVATLQGAESLENERDGTEEDSFSEPDSEASRVVKSRKRRQLENKVVIEEYVEVKDLGKKPDVDDSDLFVIDDTLVTSSITYDKLHKKIRRKLFNKDDDDNKAQVDNKTDEDFIKDVIRISISELLKKDNDFIDSMYDSIWKLLKDTNRTSEESWRDVISKAYKAKIADMVELISQSVDDDPLITKIYNSIISKINNNTSGILDTIRSQALSALSNRISDQSTFDEYDDILSVRYGSYYKTRVPKYIRGIPSNFRHYDLSEVTSFSYSSSQGKYVGTLYFSSLKYSPYVIRMNNRSLDNQNVDLIINLDTSDVDKIFYLRLMVDMVSSSTVLVTKNVKIKFEYETSAAYIFQSGSQNGGVEIFDIVLNGWYQVKRIGSRPGLFKV